MKNVKDIVYDKYRYLFFSLRKSTIGKWLTDAISLPVMLVKTDWRETRSFRFHCWKAGYKHTLSDAFGCFFKYGCSIKQYYIYRFHEKHEEERAAWLTARIMSCFFHIADPPEYNDLINDKVNACEAMSAYMQREIKALTKNVDMEDILDWVMQKPEAVIKPRVGSQGIGVEFIETTQGRDSLRRNLQEKMKSGDQIIEEVIEQHDKMRELNPSSVNTVRIQTIISENKVTVLGAVLRIGNGGRIDNMSSGGLAAAVDIETGKVMSSGFYKDITKTSGLSVHPLTGIRIPGFEIPYWQDTLELAKTMAMQLPMLKTIGWDIAITPNGPVLVEFNREWMPDTFQIPYNRGRISDLLPYLDPHCLYPTHRKHLAKNSFSGWPNAPRVEDSWQK